MKKGQHKAYHRYHIDTKRALNIVPYPNRFQVKVNRFALAKLLLKELIHYRGNLDVVLSRPCVYGVFSGPIGGFAPRDHLCVGCLRCTTQYPEMVKILPNLAHAEVGDSYFTCEQVATVVHEAETGRIPIKGAGYRGKFGGEGWDGMWTDMSEIVRPTRDGIHGREFISTEIDIGEKLPFLELDEDDDFLGEVPLTTTSPLPLIFDIPPLANLSNKKLSHILSHAAHQIHTFAILPYKILKEHSLKEPHIIPLIDPKDFETHQDSDFQPLMIELSEWNENFYRKMRSCFHNAVIILRVNYGCDLLPYYHAGIRTFHLTADYHGRGKDGKFVLELIREAHLAFVEAGCRDQVTLIGSGGIVAAEHMPKAIICGLDAVAIDTSYLVALQACFGEKSVNYDESDFKLPKTLPWNGASSASKT